MDFGDYRVEVIPDSEFRLDGGECRVVPASFGNVFAARRI